MKTRKVLLSALLVLGLLAAIGVGFYLIPSPTPLGPTALASTPLGPASAAESIERFYRDYFRHYKADPLQKTKGPTPSFSPGFIASLKQNADICAAKAGGEMCGWGANGDVYFDSQEYDPALTYENSRMRISEPKPGEVSASFNVFPSDTKAGTFYDRKLVFKLVQAEGKWVVDDMLVGGKSQRQVVEEETRAFSTAPPQPEKAK